MPVRMIVVIVLAVGLTGCAGPKFVRECNLLASNCEMVMKMYQIERDAWDWERGRSRVARETCEADNKRLLNMALQQPSKISSAEDIDFEKAAEKAAIETDLLFDKEIRQFLDTIKGMKTK